ncbi:hypothetical protein BKA70DRAFT_1471573 [Coprinopsis sp. MPI-PUGE-AT-0042]|nr:hypothetical protein BKA70DRAFT_1471573 [Coprinopsis sp. MPI-PUGE-AT-0042]
MSRLTSQVSVFFDNIGNPVDDFKRALERADKAISSITISAYDEGNNTLDTTTTEILLETLLDHIHRTQHLRVVHCHNSLISAILDQWLAGRLRHIQGLTLCRDGSPAFPISIPTEAPMLGLAIPAFTSLETLELGGYAFLQFSDCYQSEWQTGVTQLSNITISNLTQTGGYHADVLPISRLVEIVGKILRSSDRIKTLNLVNINLEKDVEEDEDDEEWEEKLQLNPLDLNFEFGLLSLLEEIQFTNVGAPVIDAFSRVFYRRFHKYCMDEMPIQVFNDCALDECVELFFCFGQTAVLRNINDPKAILAFFRNTSCYHLWVEKCEGLTDEALDFLANPVRDDQRPYEGMWGTYELTIDKCQGFSYRALKEMVIQRREVAWKDAFPLHLTEEPGFEPKYWETIRPFVDLRLLGTTIEELDSERQERLQQYTRLDVDFEF